MKPYRIYIDTNIFKFSAVKLPRLVPKIETINWECFNQNTTLHGYVEINQNNSIKNPKLKFKASLLSSLSNFKKIA